MYEEMPVSQPFYGEPSSPVDAARESLEQKMANRRSRDHVSNRGYLPASVEVSPMIVSPMVDLEKKLTSAKLNRDLPSRQTKEDLQRTHILPDGNAAPGIQRARVELEKELVQSHVGRKLSDRSGHEELQQRGIVYSAGPGAAGGAAPSLQSKMHDLEKKIQRTMLKNKLEDRQPVDQLQEGNIMHVGPGGALQAEYDSLARKMKEDALNKALTDRPPPPKSVHDAAVRDPT